MVEVKADIYWDGNTLVPDHNLIQGIFPDLDGLLHQAGVLPVLTITTRIRDKEGNGNIGLVLVFGLQLLQRFLTSDQALAG